MDVKAAEQTAVAHVDGVLPVVASLAKNRIFGHLGSLEVTIQLPARSRIVAKAAEAECRGLGGRGAVAFEGPQGSVKIDEAESAQPHPPRLRRCGRPPGRSAEIGAQEDDLHISEAVRGTVVLRTGGAQSRD